MIDYFAPKILILEKHRHCQFFSKGVAMLNQTIKRQSIHEPTSFAVLSLH